jgi:hypothetical protein
MKHTDETYIVDNILLALSIASLCGGVHCAA